MKRIYYLYLRLVIAGACLAVSSCTKYDDYTYIGPGQEQKNGILSVKEAKEFFESKIISISSRTAEHIHDENCGHGNDSIPANGGLLNPGEFTPDWNAEETNDLKIFASDPSNTKNMDDFLSKHNYPKSSYPVDYDNLNLDAYNNLFGDKK